MRTPCSPHPGWRRWLCAAALLIASPAEAWQVDVLDVADLPPAWKVRELSGLAWVPDDQVWLAVSDRGRLWRLPVGWSGPKGQERLHLAPPPPPVALTTPAGTRPNAEALAWRPASTGMPAALLVADEDGHRVLALDQDGQWQQTLPVPGNMASTRQLRGANAGIEALAWHPTNGLMAALQRPSRDRPATLHRVQAANGRHWDVRAAGRKSSVKALELMDASTLLVLERVNEQGALRTRLRPLDLAVCGGDAVCDPPALPLDHPALHGDDNFEGLACAGDGLCLVVSDDGGSGRTRLLLLRLRR